MNKKANKNLRNFSLIFVLVIALFVVSLSQNRYPSIEKAVKSMEYNNIKIAQINKVKSNKAIVFYEYGYGYSQQFGYVGLKKNFFGWRVLGSQTSQLPPNRKMGWQHTSFPFQGIHSELIYGKIIDPKISKVVLLQNSKHYKAQIVDYNGGERFWFLMPDENMSGYLVIGLSKNGQTLEEY